MRTEQEWRAQGCELDALAAHVEEPVAYISHSSEGDVLGWERQFDAPRHTSLYTAPQPASSLARLKAQWQAEALEEVASEWRRDEMNQDDTDCVEYLERKARHKRRPAKGGAP